ncbi:MAG: LEA type 2 family protein [Thermodesulfobacteriota bacterium]|nr:LEA type 2 family protein [Thermodesulfobacteriota bacterium]
MALQKFKWTGLIFLFGIGLLVAGCAGMGKKADPPKVNIVNINVSEFRALETSFNIELRLINPNDFPLKIRGIQFDMKAQGKEFATGVSNQSVDVPALGSEIVQVEAFASFVKMAASVWDIVKGTEKEGGSVKELKYDLSGKLLVSNPDFSKKAIPFDSKGELSFDQ